MKSLKRLFGIKPEWTVFLYMKSGNVIKVDRVNSPVDFKYKGDMITEISNFKQHARAKNRLILGALALNQIEAISVQR